MFERQDWAVLTALFLTMGPVKASDAEYQDLQLEDLLNVQVTSAAKKAQSLSDAPAAIFVVSHDDIQHSGATTIPDALRMVPGVDVARIDANKWAVSARGFNGRFANKLLVLIDGRSVYTQAFSGVYWETQDVMLEDVERIEVIRGPGATLWGANAANGVINIITKNSADTQGGLVTAGGGSHEQGFGSLRYGMKLGKDTTARLYVKGNQRAQFKYPTGAKARDDWNKVQAGGRVDSLLTAKDQLTVSSDIYYSDIHQTISLPSLASPSYFQNHDETTNAGGGNLNARLEHTFSTTSSYALQVYYDIYARNELFVHQKRHTADIDFQHHFAFNDWNSVIWGLGYRFMKAETRLPMPKLFTLREPDRQDNYFSAFLQNEMTLINDQLWLTLGSKFEHNDYTGFEVQPTARVMWTPHGQHRLWGAISRAVRTPSVIEAELGLLGAFLPPGNALNPTPIPVAAYVTGSHGYKAEEILAFELGHRFTFAQSMSLDTTAFYNDYQSLRSFFLGTPSYDGAYIKQPFVVDNSSKGRTLGFETSLVWQALDWWRWDLNYSYLNTRMVNNPYYKESISPQHKVSVRSSVTPWQDLNLDVWLRYVDKSSVFTLQGTIPVDGYVTMDIRLGWRPHKSIELSLTGQNLLDGHHLEALQESYTSPTEIPRSIYGKIAWNF